MSSFRLNQRPMIDPDTLKQGLAQQAITLIDVREPGEFAGERIPGATLMPLSRLDPRKIPQTEEMQVVLYCRSGHRSAVAAKKLAAAGFEPAQLSGGLLAWKAAGHPTLKNENAPISLVRQVQIVAGSLVVTGTVLGAFVSPWFLLLSGFVGSGLVFAGVTDTCLLARLLAKLPYNQRAEA